VVNHGSPGRGTRRRRPELLRDDTAALNVAGTDRDANTMRGRVIMHKDDGAWKVSARKLRRVVSE
jgi:hypothetical protein